MATRKIIDAKHNGEKVWLKGHAQATYMSNGSTVEDAINSIQEGSGEAVPETDPVFSASPAASITEANKQAWSNKQDAISDLTNIRNGAAKGATAVQPSSLATVATSGSYNDLSNKPTIPSAVTESTVSGWGFTKNAGTYSKPSGGIPKSDLASAVQTSLGKADTALQSYTEQYKGTITGISANGTSVATSGVANIPAASTSKYGVTKLSSATNSTSTSLAATASAVKAAYDLANSYKGTVTGVKINGTTKNPTSGVVDLGTVITAHQDISGKQDKLVSGTNIKTINGESIVGSGDITIGGGGEAVTEVKVNNVSKSPANGVIDIGYINKPVSELWESSVVLSPNVYYRIDYVRELTITLDDESENNSILNEYFIEFSTDINGAVISFPYYIRWANGREPVFEGDCAYQVSIVNNFGTYVKFYI